MNEIIWRPYQIACKQAIKENLNKGVNKQLIVAATGVGKRMMAVNIMHHFPRALFIAHREELIMQAFEEIESYWPFQTGVIKGPRFDIGKRIVVASVQTLYNRLDKIDPNMFPLIIVDECFPAGTMIDSMPIEDVRTGMLINCFNHEKNAIERKSVLNIQRREYNKSLYDFGEFKCTPNHPIFIVDIGYCIAKEIYYAYICYKVMRYGFKTFTKSKLFKLWKRIFFSRIRTNERNIHGFSKKRFWLLLEKMQKGIFQEGSFYYDEQNKSKVLFRKNEEEQSNVQSGISKKNETIFKRKNIFVSWWKRRSDQATTYYGGIDPITNGTSSNGKVTIFTREKPSKLLQGRFSLSRSKTSNRNRWEDSPIKALEILRQTKDGRIEKSRMDCDKIYKRRSRSKSSESSEKNYVYNIEVKENNNYFANSILVHNCHHYCSPTYLKTIRHFTPKLLTAWTATPKRLDGLSLSNIVQDIVFEYRIENGIKDGFLAPIEAYQIRTPVDISKIKRTAGDFNQKELSEHVDTVNRNNLIVAKYLEYTPGRQALAYCVDMNHAYNLRDVFRERGVICETIVSDEKRCPNRDQLIKDFKEGKITVLTNVNILTEGFDYSEVGCVLMGRPTQSETLYVQCIGRGTRLKSEVFKDQFKTDKCIILDFVDNSGRLSLMNAYELEKGMPIEDRIFLSEENRQKLIKTREERIHKLEVIYGKDKKINLLRLPEVKPWDYVKMLEPATEKQLDWIKRIGVWQEDVEYTKTMASELISCQPASSSQVIWLGQQNYDVSGAVTIGQYQKVKWIKENREKYKMKPQS